MESTEKFDPDYMRALFDVGYELGSSGDPRNDSPPGIELNMPAAEAEISEDAARASD